MTTTFLIALFFGIAVFALSAYNAYKLSKTQSTPIQWQYPIGFGLGAFLLILIIAVVAQ